MKHEQGDEREAEAFERREEVEVRRKVELVMGEVAECTLRVGERCR